MIPYPHLFVVSFVVWFDEQLGHTAADGQWTGPTPSSSSTTSVVCSPCAPGCAEYPDRLLLLKRRRVATDSLRAPECAPLSGLYSRE